MRQKDINRVASILDREMQWADHCEVEGLKQAIGAIMRDVGWAPPELDMGPLEMALNAPLLRDYGMFSPCYICGDPEDHRGRPHGEATGDGRVRADVDPESHIVRGED